MQTALKPPSVATAPRWQLKVERILVPLDFSGPSIAVLHFAVAFARAFNACIHLVHVHREDEDVMNSGAAEQMMQFGEATTFLQNSDREIRQAMPCVWPDNCHLRAGEAAAEISATAREINADLIVIATRSRSGLKHRLLGSTAERVVRHADCPVLVPRVEENISKLHIAGVLAPVDFSAQSNAALQYAARLAASFAAKLSLLHVVEPVHASTPTESREIEEAQIESSERSLHFLQRSYPISQLASETLVLCGQPAKEIVAAAERHGSDLIVLSNRGATGSHARLGSTAEQVVRRAKTSVLTVPSGFLPTSA